MKQSEYFSIKLVQKDSSGESEKVIFLDQTKLPLEEIYVETDSYERIAEAIERLEVRGAPLIGISAAYALALSLKNVSEDHQKAFNDAYSRLAQTRPTAVNLFKALTELKDEFELMTDKTDAYRKLLSKAKDIHKADEVFCQKIGRNGLSLFKGKANVLTHCNTGKLATGGMGTAFGIIKTAFENGLLNHVYADETRPLLQGLRLTSFELDRSGIPFTFNLTHLLLNL
jgi:methylthioribose-1-phosphate isomerase